MTCAVVYSSRTGNTRELAGTLRSCISQKELLYFGGPDEAALQAERICAGFWTDKGNCDGEMKEFLGKLRNKEVFLFGTAGFGGSGEYFERILSSVKENLGPGCRVIGTYMCQGKMPYSVRERYVKMMAQPDHMPGLEGMIENFDRALSHPGKEDLKALEEAARRAGLGEITRVQKTDDQM